MLPEHSPTRLLKSLRGSLVGDYGTALSSLGSYETVGMPILESMSI